MKATEGTAGIIKTVMNRDLREIENNSNRKRAEKFKIKSTGKSTSFSVVFMLAQSLIPFTQWKLRRKVITGGIASNGGSNATCYHFSEISAFLFILQRFRKKIWVR